MSQQQFPEGWDEARVRRVLEHYEGQSDKDEAAEIADAAEPTALIEVPVDLVPEVRELIAKRRPKPPR